MQEFITKTNAGHGLGIAGFVLGILSLFFSFIPCIGIIAIIPGIIGIILSTFGYHQAKKGNGTKGIVVAALVISILGTVISAAWGIIISSVIKSDKWLENTETVDSTRINQLEDIMDDLDTTVTQETTTYDTKKHGK